MKRSFSTDVLVDILQRLPPSAQRRSRLVCRLWHEVVGERTTEMQSRAKPLPWNTRTVVARIVDDPSPSSTGSCRELWRGPRGATNLQLVGTCNGLLCLCDNSCMSRAGGDVTLVNPATRETLAIPPLPCDGQFVGHQREATRWDKAYSFAYHPTSGQYKVVHVPCSFDWVCKFDTVDVLTLGKEAFWRKVPTHRGTSCNLDAGIVSVDGVTHWITDDDAARVVSFDLDNEHITFSTPPLPAWSDDYNLTEVHGMLGVVVRNRLGRDAWVLKKGRWIHRYRVKFSWKDIPRPNFAFGQHFLTREGTKLYGHTLYGYWAKGSASSGWHCWRPLRDVLEVSYDTQGTLVAKMTGDSTCYFYDNYQTFAYVSTLEPLDVYSTKSS